MHNRHYKCQFVNEDHEFNLFHWMSFREVQITVEVFQLHSPLQHWTCHTRQEHYLFPKCKFKEFEFLLHLPIFFFMKLHKWGSLYGSLHSFTSMFNTYTFYLSLKTKFFHTYVHNFNFQKSYFTCNYGGLNLENQFHCN